MNKTSIEWVKNPDGSQGFTSNPVRGECPVNCSYCYVKPFRARYGWHKDIRFYPAELEAFCRRKKPAGIFVGSTIELFHDKTIQYMPEIMETIKDCPQHRFYLLTKQPQNLAKFSPFPENCWVGVTATNGDMLFNALLGLSIIKASRKYISFEPLLGSMGERKDSRLDGLKVAGINQVIIGAQTKPYRPPEIESVLEIVNAADLAGTSIFLKDNLRPVLPLNAPYFVLNEGLNEYQLRQEMP